MSIHTRLTPPVAHKDEIRAPGRSEARATGALLMAGAGLVALSLVLPHPAGGHFIALVATACGMAVVGLVCWFASPPGCRCALTHLLLAGTALVTAVLIWESGLAVGQYGTIFIWATLISAYFFPRRVAAAQLAWLLLVYAGALAVVESTGGYSPVTRWIFSAVSLTVVMLFINNLAARRELADTRARHFFDLSQDMLCTMDTHGRCIEVNAAWERNLGFRPEQIRGKRLLDFTHPDDHQNATEEAMKVFSGGVSDGLETRVKAKDGSWHWLRTSSVFEPEEELVYARSVDVTERKRIAREREDLIAEVQKPGHLRRAHRAAQPARPRRSAAAGDGAITAGRVAALPGDHRHRPLQALQRHPRPPGRRRGAARLRRRLGRGPAWRRHDPALRRRGVPRRPARLRADDATEIVERLRAATPDEQTCSAGLALWRPGESVDELVGRADKALYEAKENGRDRLVSAAALTSDGGRLE